MAMGRMPEDGGDELQSVFSDINITPLTDIFLVLLIIFMVGASMAVDAAGSAAGGDRGAMKVDLPSGAAKDLAPGSKDVIVVILPDGRVVLAGQEIADERLTEELRTALAHASDSTLIVQADEGVHHGRVVAVMEKAREAGFTRLAVATRGE